MTSTHREVLAEALVRIPANCRPEPGPIAVLPVQGEPYNAVDAVLAAGGEAAELSAATRGLVFTSARDAELLAATLDAHPGIGWVQLPFAGIDALAKRMVQFAERGVVFTSAKGSYAQPVAEHALTLVLALLRQVPVRVRAETWGPSSGLSLYGKHVVIVGGGGIALELLRLLEPFGVRTTVVRRRAAPIVAADRTVTNAEIDDVLPAADVVVIAAPATDETKSMFNAERLASMKTTAVLVNVGRGPLIDTDALVAALAAGELWGAGLDVTDPEPLPDGHPLWTNDRAIITPHTADTAEMVAPLMQKRIRDNVRAFLAREELIGIADPRLGY